VHLECCYIDPCTGLYDQASRISRELGIGDPGERRFVTDYNVHSCKIHKVLHGTQLVRFNIAISWGIMNIRHPYLPHIWLEHGGASPTTKSSHSPPSSALSSSSPNAREA
jgi:hypothetical protein